MRAQEDRFVVQQACLVTDERAFVGQQDAFLVHDHALVVQQTCLVTDERAFVFDRRRLLADDHQAISCRRLVVGIGR